MHATTFYILSHTSHPVDGIYRGMGRTAHPYMVWSQVLENPLWEVDSMRTTLALQSLLRTPLKTLLTFLLLASTSYMLFYNAAEFAVTSREFERAAGFYQGVGMVEAGEMPKNEHLYDGYRHNLVVEELHTAGTEAFIYADGRIARQPTISSKPCDDRSASLRRL